MNSRLALLVTFAVTLLLAPPAFSFCGFFVGGTDEKLYADVTSVILMRDGIQTVLSMQNDYVGPLEEFSLVIPVPEIIKKNDIKTLSPAVFNRVNRLSSPRLVEYWERDPCFGENSRGMGFGIRGSVFGENRIKALSKNISVDLKAAFSVAEYDIVVLNAKNSAALTDWLTEHKYKVPKNAEKLYEPYIQKGQYFFVAKVNPEKVTFDPKTKRARLSPLRFHYESEDFTLPVRLGLLNSRGNQELIVHILAKNARYEAANYKNVRIPTNLELNPLVLGLFDSFYKSLFNRMMKKHPGAIVTEYSWPTDKCDPCPIGRNGLSNGDIETLGADVIGTEKKSPWILTRLHTRYSKNIKGKDLILKRARNLHGGTPKDNGTGATLSKFGNRFQGRYIVRHRWTGLVSCKNPHRGIWNGLRGKVTTAPNPFDVKRKVNLEQMVKGKLPKTIR